MHGVTSFPDEAIERHIIEAAKAPTELCLMHLYPIDGAVRRVSRDRTPWVPTRSGRCVRWSIDFIADTLADGRRFRVLNVVDDFTRAQAEIARLERRTSTRAVRSPNFLLAHHRVGHTQQVTRRALAEPRSAHVHVRAAAGVWFRTAEDLSRDRRDLADAEQQEAQEVRGWVAFGDRKSVV